MGLLILQQADLHIRAIDSEDVYSVEQVRLISEAENIAQIIVRFEVPGGNTGEIPITRVNPTEDDLLELDDIYTKLLDLRSGKIKMLNLSNFEYPKTKSKRTTGKQKVASSNGEGATAG